MFSAFIASYLVIYIGNAPKYAIDKVMSSEARGMFHLHFHAGLCYKSFESVCLSAGNQQNGSLWHEKKISQFNKLILRQIALILLLSVAAIIGDTYLEFLSCH